MENTIKLSNEQIFSYIDHTILRPTATFAEVSAVCAEAMKYKTASACIPPSFVKRIRSAYKELNICTVIGFPLGYSTRETKLFEAKCALLDGADEIDTVVNGCDVKDGLFGEITEELKEMKKLCGGKILKVIVETCYLSETEKIALCRAVTEAKADFIKTSTGFGTGGAQLSDIALFKANIGENVKIKAAGGIRTREEIEAFIAAGCQRIGTSSAVKLLTKGE